MGYPHFSGECDEFHDLVRDFGPFTGHPRNYALGSIERQQAGRAHRPEIVVLCGSTKFHEEYLRANYDLTMQGKIVLSVGFYLHSSPSHKFKQGGTGCCAICDDLPGQGEHALTTTGEGIGHTNPEKVMLDELHKRKIDLADTVFVINVGGYVGDSTRSEIEYAIRQDKPVEYLEPLP